MGFSVGADPDSPEEIALVIRDLANDPARLQKMAQAALAAASAYDRVNELQKFVNIFSRLRSR